MLPSRSPLVFWRNILPLFSGLKSKPSKKNQQEASRFLLLPRYLLVVLFDPKDGGSRLLQRAELCLLLLLFGLFHDFLFKPEDGSSMFI
jgi:hypothetical protein